MTIYDIKATPHELFHMAFTNKKKLNRELYAKSDMYHESGIAFKSKNIIMYKGITEGFAEYLSRKCTDSKAKDFDYYFANFDGIDGYKLVPNWDVTGRMKVILDPGSSYLLNKAYNELQNNITQGTEDIVMFPPNVKNIDIYAMVDVDIDMVNPYSDTEKEDIKNKISSAIKVFIDEGYKTNGEWCSGLSIGEDFIPHKLAVFLDNEIPELKNIAFKYPEDYVAIGDDELGKVNNINIEMI